MPTVAIDTNTSGDNTLVVAKAGYRIRVLNFVVAVASSVSLKFKSGSTGLTGAMPVATSLVSGWGAFGPAGFQHHFETASGEALVLNLSGGVQVSGWLNYDLIACF